MTPERMEELTVKVVDDVATAAEREELMAWLVDHPDARAELERQQALKALTDGWVSRLEHDLVNDRYEQRGVVRAERAIGVTLVLVGFALLSGFGVYALFGDPEVPVWVKMGTGAMTAGGLLLLLSVIRWRLATRKSDPYEEVIR